MSWSNSKTMQIREGLIKIVWIGHKGHKYIKFGGDEEGYLRDEGKKRTKL